TCTTYNDTENSVRNTENRDLREVNKIRNGSGHDILRPHRDQEDLRRHRRPAQESRQAEAQSRASAIRSGLLQGSREARRRPTHGCARYQKASQSGKLRSGQRDQEEIAGSTSGRRRRSQAETEPLLRSSARTNLP